MSEPAVRQRLREAREKATAEREAGKVQSPSMFQAAVEAAVGMLPDVPIATVEQVVLTVLRVALPLHETSQAVRLKMELAKCVDLNRELVNENADMRVELAELRRVHEQCKYKYVGAALPPGCIEVTPQYEEGKFE